MTETVKPARLARREIEERASEVLKRHGLTSIPIDPVRLANIEGIKVHNAKFSKPNTAGLIAKRGSATSVLVERDDQPTRKRFTIAHELGHYYLHLMDGGEFVDSFIDLKRSDSQESHAPTKLMEIEANQFAAALLMPADRVKEIWAAVRSVEEAARIFRVSKEAMAIRLDTLGLE